MTSYRIYTDIKKPMYKSLLPLIPENKSISYVIRQALKEFIERKKLNEIA
jgi:hypothetical protein